MTLPNLKPETMKALQVFGSSIRALPMTHTLVSIWQAGNPKEVRRLEESGELITLLRHLSDQLEVAQDLTGTQSHLAHHEILEMAGLPLKLTSQTSRS